MRKPRTIKPSSLSLLSRLILAELVLLGLGALLAPLANYEQLYREIVEQQLHFYRYDIIIVFSASLIQILVTLIIFLGWEREFFTLTQHEIIHQTGIIFTKENSCHFSQVETIAFATSPIQRYFKTGTILLRLNDQSVTLKNIDQARTWLFIIRNLLAEQASQREEQEIGGVDQLISRGEGALIEFKRSLRWDHKLGVGNKLLEKATLKTIAAFLNTDGGRLLIGIADDGEVTGLVADYQTIQRPDRDGFENHFTQVFKSMIDIRFRRLVKLSFETTNNQDVCLLEISPAPEPVFLKTGELEEFYIRTGNTTTLLSLKQALDYINRRWL